MSVDDSLNWCVDVSRQTESLQTEHVSILVEAEQKIEFDTQSAVGPSVIDDEPDDLKTESQEMRGRGS